MYDDLFGGLFAQDFFDRPERPWHVQHLPHFRFADMQRHSALLSLGEAGP
jgi:hypothetical protein